MIKRTLIATAATAALFAATAAPAAQADVCVTYDFAGSELCVLATAGQATSDARQTLRDNDRCVTYDFTGRDFCVVRDTIG